MPEVYLAYLYIYIYNLLMYIYLSKPTIHLENINLKKDYLINC